MTSKIRSILRSVMATILVVVAFTNVWAFISLLRAVPAREFDAMTILENRLREFRQTLVAAHYTAGNIGYMPLEVLRGRPRTRDEDITWVEARYVMIPLNLQQETLDAPYVILDISGSDGAIEIPDGFLSVYGPKDGFILLQRKPAP